MVARPRGPPLGFGLWHCSAHWNSCLLQICSRPLTSVGLNRPCRLAACRAAVCVTYWANRLQPLPAGAPNLFVTLNPIHPPAGERSGLSEQLLLVSLPSGMDLHSLLLRLPLPQARGSLFWGLRTGRQVVALQFVRTRCPAEPSVPLQHISSVVPHAARAALTRPCRSGQGVPPPHAGPPRVQLCLGQGAARAAGRAGAPNWEKPLFLVGQPSSWGVAPLDLRSALLFCLRALRRSLGSQRHCCSPTACHPPSPSPSPSPSPGHPQGQGGVYLAGAWCGYGFHEDGIRSAVEVVKAMGERPPAWRTPRHAPLRLPCCADHAQAAAPPECASPAFSAVPAGWQCEESPHHHPPHPHAHTHAHARTTATTTICFPSVEEACREPVSAMLVFLGAELGTPCAARAGGDIPWVPRSVSPKIPLLDRAAIALFDKFARAAIRTGRLRLILPSGEELVYGDASKTAAPVPKGRLFARWGQRASGIRGSRRWSVAAAGTTFMILSCLPTCMHACTHAGAMQAAVLRCRVAFLQARSGGVGPR